MQKIFAKNEIYIFYLPKYFLSNPSSAKEFPQ